MFERMLNKAEPPDACAIEEHIGAEAWARLSKLGKWLDSRYQISRELRFPFGNSYGWGYKYSHKLKHLCYIFFEKDAITAIIQIPDKEVPILEEQYTMLSDKGKAFWITAILAAGAEDGYIIGLNRRRTWTTSAVS